MEPIVSLNLGDEEDGGQRISWWNTVKNEILCLWNTVKKETLRLWNTMKKEKLRLWNTFFILLCVFGVFNDPIFCYMNAIDNEHKCITTDMKMAWFYIWSRTAIDALYLIDMLFTYEWCCGGRRSWKSFLSNLLSTLSRIFVFLPIPQVFVAFLRIHGGLKQRPIYLLFTPIQFLLRIYLLYGSIKQRSIIDITGAERWLRHILDFVPFILASHLFGAFWYHLTIHTQTDCWMSTRHQIYPKDYHFELSNSISFVACKANRTETYYLGSNISRWDDLCPVKQADPKTFDFGIYFYALQSDVASSTRPLLQRVFQSFWWALRNLSSFGSNLNSSMNPWEVLFSVMISIGGMALFLVYLNARLQESQERSNKLIQKKMQESQERSDKLILQQKTQLMNPNIDLWLYKNNLSTDMKTAIVENIHKLEENNNLDMKNVLSILPIKDKKNIMWFLLQASRGNVPVLQNINEKVLEAICQHLMPVTYVDDSYIVQEGEPLGKMLLITQGIAVTYSNVGHRCGCSRNKWLKKGNFYGEELLDWAFKSPSFSDLPISNRNVIVQEKVEAFSIRASDLKSVFLKFWWLFSREVEVSQWEHLAASYIQATWRHRHARNIAQLV